MAVLELGAGVGLTGVLLAALGAHVTLTDLADVVARALPHCCLRFAEKQLTGLAYRGAASYLTVCMCGAEQRSQRNATKGVAES